MLFYDWSKIKRYSDRKVQTIRTIFESMLEIHSSGVGRKKYDRLDFTGESYLLKPFSLLKEFETGNQIDAANCLMLASYRNFGEYLVSGDFYLPLELISIPTNKLKQNSLLDIQGTNIHFLTEK